MLLLALIFVCLPSIYYQGQYWVNGNISWLMIAAERLLNGQSLSGHIYETNPPLSIVLYTPHVLLSHITGVAKVDIVYPFTLLCALLSTLSIYKIIKPWVVITDHQKASLLFGYFAAVTIGTTLSISEREHYIALALVPFILCQYNLSHNIKTPNLIIWPVLIIGAAIILVKPHYGIVPSYFLLQRLLKDKNINTIFKVDFWSLSVMTSLYALLLATIFSDYITDIFHDVVTLYFGHPDITTTMKTAEMFLVVFFLMPAIELFQKDLSKEQRRLLFTFYCGCLLCLIPYFVQMKGYYYHMVPAYVFFLCGLTLSLSLRMPSIFKNIPIMQSLIPAIAILSFLNVFSQLSTNVLTKDEIKELPISHYLQKECTQPCTFYAFHGDIETFIPISFALRYEFGSRFSAYWFLPELVKGLNSDKNSKYDLIHYKYSTLVARDFEYYKPSLLLIHRNIHITPDGAFEYTKFFKNNTKFKRIIEDDYRFIETRSFDSAPYFKGTTLGGQHMMDFDIYKRIDQDLLLNTKIDEPA